MEACRRSFDFSFCKEYRLSHRGDFEYLNKETFLIFVFLLGVQDLNFIFFDGVGCKIIVELIIFFLSMKLSLNCAYDQCFIIVLYNFEQTKLE